MEESSFIIDNNGSLISQCQRIQYDSANELKTKVCEAEQPQHQMAIEKYELNCNFTPTPHPPLPPCWFSLNNSEKVKTVTLEFCSI